MIMPWLKGFILPRHAPVTWALFFTNLLLFIVFSFQADQVDRAYLKHFHNEEIRRVQGFVFAQYIERHPAQFSPFYRELSDKAFRGHEVALSLLSSLAVRDRSFAENIRSFSPIGDQVALARWQKDYGEFHELQKTHPGHIYGLSEMDPSWLKTITYQFVHGDYMHLLVNMTLLMIFGCMIESVIGSVGFLLVYLCGGIFAAGAFVGVTGLTMAPLIGASGSVSALIGFFSLVFWRRKVTYFYFLLPRQGYYGFTHLPAWIFFALWTTGELASQIAEVAEVGGVAHSAHLGGVSIGLLMGGLFLIWRKATAKSVLRN